ncbi:Hypothetical protein PACV_332 [Pacmanvirus A23]|uniref:Hypothetical protein n=1 Tax=Pacmanvirus A23 TaxID=1932881 RepID=UPI000A0959E0|nr:Hypothetical protein B9W72_gp328 [Pacmanvirus A23]SIP86045.1 Hypothetical protein PACV_332 [Pacmanvirus A23]
MSSTKSPMEKLTSIFGTMLDSKLKEIKDSNTIGQQEIVIAIGNLNERLDNIEKTVDIYQNKICASKNAKTKSAKNLQMAVDLLLLRIDELETKINTTPQQIPNVRINDIGPAPNMFKQDEDIDIDFD